MQCKTVSASVACACVCVCVCALHTRTHTQHGIQRARPTVRMHIELKQQTEEKRRVEGLKFSISGYRLQQCLMQKKQHNSKMPSCLFPKAWWETFPKAWWSLGNNRAEPGRRDIRKTTECVFKSLESRFFLRPSGFLLSLTAGSDRMRERGQRRRGWSERELRWRERQPVS